ncbi:FkbM family methyltransferase [Parvibaculum sp.]|uniref:FkbM family methyltransferase n=1 Tax=Parvibaculum sp. TaxID=2024848 RepID=UPI003BAA31F4
MRERIFAAIARRFPTELVGTNRFVAGLWRILFYLFRPQKPFIMRTQHYRLRAHPRKGTLTRVVLRRGCWEACETDFFISRLKPGGFVVDAGANFGHYALVASNIVGPEGLVVAFEPFPANHALLTENVALLPTKNVVAEQAGLAATSGTFDLITDEANPGGHSFNPDLIWKQGNKISVPIHALDDYIADRRIDRRLDVLKSDTQGYEWQLISGARKTILRDKPLVLCEVAPKALKAIGDSHEELLRFFEEAGYSMLMVDRSRDELMPLGYEALKLHLGETGREFEDVVFLPPAETSEACLDRVPDEAGEIGIVETVDLLNAGR